MGIVYFLSQFSLMGREADLKNDLKSLIRGTVEDTLNAMLERRDDKRVGVGGHRCERRLLRDGAEHEAYLRAGEEKLPTIQTC